MAVCTCTTEVCMQSQILTQKAAGSAKIREGLWTRLCQRYTVHCLYSSFWYRDKENGPWKSLGKHTNLETTELLLRFVLEVAVPSEPLTSFVLAICVLKNEKRLSLCSHHWLQTTGQYLYTCPHHREIWHAPLISYSEYNSNSVFQRIFWCLTILCTCNCKCWWFINISLIFAHCSYF